MRCRVAQVDGLGLLERLNRTFKHEFVFRHEVNTRADLKALVTVLPALVWRTAIEPPFKLSQMP